MGSAPSTGKSGKQNRNDNIRVNNNNDRNKLPGQILPHAYGVACMDMVLRTTAHKNSVVILITGDDHGRVRIYNSVLLTPNQHNKLNNNNDSNNNNNNHVSNNTDKRKFVKGNDSKSNTRIDSKPKKRHHVSRDTINVHTIIINQVLFPPSSSSSVPLNYLGLNAYKFSDTQIHPLRFTLHKHFQAYLCYIKCLDFHRSKRLFVSGGSDGKVKVWSLKDMSNPRLVKCLAHKHLCSTARYSEFYFLRASIMVCCEYMTLNHNSLWCGVSNSQLVLVLRRQCGLHPIV